MGWAARVGATLLYMAVQYPINHVINAAVHKPYMVSADVASTTTRPEPPRARTPTVPCFPGSQQDEIFHVPQVQAYCAGDWGA